MAKEITPPLPRVRSFLRHQRAYLAVYERYQRTIPASKIEEHQLLESLVHEARDHIALAARAIRMLDGVAQNVEPHAKLIQQGFARRSTTGKLQFIYVGLGRILEFLESQQELPDPPAVRELWDAAHAGYAMQREAVRQLLAQYSNDPTD